MISNQQSLNLSPFMAIYDIVVQNSELKHRHGYDVASSSGLVGIHMQGQ